LGNSIFCRIAALDPKPITRAHEKLLDAGVEITQAPDAVELAYLSRELVQCTLPHSDPGEVPLWTRTNGNLTLVVARTGFDPKTLTPIGYPYGSLPRLLLCALRQSPLALDLYIWATHKAFSVAVKGKSQFVPWVSLSLQFGADYKQTRDFKQKAIAALKKIQTVYPALKLQDVPGGLVVLASSRPAVPLKS
jgi:hypothetical protein